MIVSFRHRLAFVAVPKTGTHAVRQALRPLLDPRDWEQCTLLEPRRAPHSAIAEVGHGHLTAAELAASLPGDLFTQFFSFAVIRDPLDRFRSLAWFLNRNTTRMQDDPKGTMLRMLERAARAPNPWTRPQAEYVLGGSGDRLVTHLARYEDLQREVDAVRRMLGAPPLGLARVNASPPSDRARGLDPEVRAAVQEIYAADVALRAELPVAGAMAD